MALFYGGVQVAQPVCQVITSTFSATINSTSFQAVSGHSVTLTPQSSSCKFLVIMETAGTMDTGSSNGQFQITRYNHTTTNSDEVHTGGAYANPGGIRALMPMYSVHLDSPNVTNQLTYAVNFKKHNGGGLGTANFGVSGSITVIELES